jgi:hypothetical protein
MSHSLVPEYSEMTDAYEVCTLFQKLKQVPDGQAVPVSVDNAFFRLADTISQKWFLASCGIPAVRAIRIWKGWLVDPLPNPTGRRILVRRSLISYYLLVGAGFLIACFSGDRFLRTIAIGALSFLVARTAFLVSTPISALEPRHLTAFFPLIDVIGLCALWKVLAALFRHAHVSFGWIR